MLLKDNMNRLLLKENLAKHCSVKNKRLHMQLFCRFIFFCLSLKKKRPLSKSVLFCAEIWSLKALVGRIAARARFRKFFARLVLCWLLSFSVISIKSSVKEQTIMISIYLFSVFLNIFNVSHWKQFYICSLGVNFLQNSLCYGATRAPNSLLISFTPGLSSTWSGPWFPSWATLKHS